MSSRAAKNIAMSKGKSIGKLIVNGAKKIGNWWMDSHKAKQKLIDEKGKYVIGS